MRLPARLVCLLCLGPAAALAPGQERPRQERTGAAKSWSDDLPAALKEAQKSGKPVLVDVGATWCGACQKLDGSFRDAGVLSVLNANFVAVRLDADRDAEWVQRHNVTSLPTMLVLSADGRELARKRSYQTPAELKQWLAQQAATHPAAAPAAAAVPAPSFPVSLPIPTPTQRPAADPWAACHSALVAALDAAPASPPR